MLLSAKDAGCGVCTGIRILADPGPLWIPLDHIGRADAQWSRGAEFNSRGYQGKWDPPVLTAEARCAPTAAWIGLFVPPYQAHSASAEWAELQAVFSLVSSLVEAAASPVAGGLPIWARHRNARPRVRPKRS